MNADDLVRALDYGESSSFITADRFDEDPSRAHALRRARESCGLHGVYALVDHREGGSGPALTPVVYVCDVDKAEQNDPAEVHRLIWNQNFTPFLIAVTRREVRLYPGFKYEPQRDSHVAEPILESTIEQAAAALRHVGLDADSIDAGLVWSALAEHVTPSERVDWKLLGNLRDLGDVLNQRLPRSTAHALIGKYVYLKYLDDRGILSQRKLKAWGLGRESVFGRQASRESLQKVAERLEDWLNGSIFPLSFRGPNAPSDEDVSLVASTFEGDEPLSGQLHLGFKAYDFSYIPIETLSNVYEQFLHAEQQGAGKPPKKKRARRLGAYYTPVHLVDFILNELDSKRPLTRGMTVFDPACGSGAFLVQAYRRLVERERAAAPDVKLTPARLRNLLVSSVFGLDLDEDACRVAHLSLLLTLLDYVSPPDLENSRYRDFQMPDLMNTNIFHCIEGFFDPSSGWPQHVPSAGFDRIVSNPPWRDLKSGTQRPEEQHALAWMRENRQDRPTGGNQVAEAFAWRAADFLSADGMVGMLLPAMTLFKTESRAFRREFLSKQNVWCVLNLANLRRDLFADRAEVPAAVFFYSGAAGDEGGVGGTGSILTYAPMTATQVASRSQEAHRRKEPWVIEIDGSEIKEIVLADAATGSSIVWKAAMWGSPRDIRLIESLRRRFEPLAEFAQREGLLIHEGPQIRRPPSRAAGTSEEIELCNELSGKMRLQVGRLRNLGRIYSIPKEALERIDARRVYVRKGRKDVPLSICRPPHVIVDATRRFAVFSSRFIAVPPRHVGIAGRRGQEDLLKALALYLNSQFAIYHDFYVSPAWGIHLVRSDLSTLRALPTPLSELDGRGLTRWASLHDRLVDAFEAEQNARRGLLRSKRSRTSVQSVQDLKDELNAEVGRVLGLDDDERCLMEDLVRVKLDMIEGKWNESLVRQASEEELAEYGKFLKRALDDFLSDDKGRTHVVTITHDEHSAWVCVSLVNGGRDAAVAVRRAQGEEAKAFDDMRRRLRARHSQWFYFNRSLRMFEGQTTHLFKPAYRLAWLRSRALTDADDLVADMLSNEGK